MSVGLGLLLGLAILSFITLYIATKDRWKWKRIALVVLGVFVGLPGLGLGVYFGWEALPKAVTPQSELWGISLGMPRKEVLFRKGPPSDTTGGTWSFKQEYAPMYSIAFERDSVWWIWAQEASSAILPSVAGLSGDESQEEVIRKLGQPTYVSTSADGGKRILNFERPRVFVELWRNKVTGIGVYRPSVSSDGIRFVDEDTTLSR